MDGLGITFDAYGSVQHHARGYHQPHHPVHRPAVAAHLVPHQQRLQHSVSYDAALNGHYSGQPMYRHPSDMSGESAHKRVRIAAGTPEVLNGKGGYLPYDQHHLSPLSDFGQSTASGTGSSQPFSPASLSSLPSSTDAGAYPSFPSHALPHDAYPIRNHPHATSHADLHHAQHPSPSRGPSRLPAFLQDRQQREGALARPRSMVELRQSQQQRERASPPTSMHAPYAEHVEHAPYEASPSDPYEHLQDSPAESVPSSAGALQRRHFERQLQSEFDERRRLRASEGRPRERTQSEGVIRPLERVRSRSLSAKEMKELADRDAARRIEEPAQAPQEGAAARPEVEDDETLEAEEADDDVGTVISLAPPPQREAGASGLQRQSTLLTAGASTVRRRKELDRLLAPTSRHAGISSLGTIAQSPTPSTTSSAVTHSTQPRAASHTSTQVASLPSPVVLEQAKHGKGARVELDLVLETPLVVEGGLLKGRLEVRIRKSKEREGEVWIGTPKIRVIGFEGASALPPSRPPPACSSKLTLSRCRALLWRRPVHLLPRLGARLDLDRPARLLRLARRRRGLPPRQERAAQRPRQDEPAHRQGRQGPVEGQAGRRALHRDRVRPPLLVSPSNSFSHVLTLFFFRPQFAQAQEQGGRRPLDNPLLPPRRGVPLLQPGAHARARRQAAHGRRLQVALHGRERQGHAACVAPPRDLGRRAALLRRGPSL